MIQKSQSGWTYNGTEFPTLTSAKRAAYPLRYRRKDARTKINKILRQGLTKSSAKTVLDLLPLAMWPQAQSQPIKEKCEEKING